MKKYLVFFVLFTALAACKETEFEPEGPTDVRIKNLSDVIFTDVKVKIKEEEQSLGTINPGSYSEYFRFEIAYPLIEISATINGLLFTTGPVDPKLPQVYIGQDRITYMVYISNMNTRELKINDVIREEPLVLK
jgi:hypothetical protein